MKRILNPGIKVGVAAVGMSWTLLAGANPVAYSPESIEKGAHTFLQFCTECHGKDGRAQMDVISDATNLTAPEEYYNGTTQDDIFNSIKNGAGVGMPPWGAQFSDENDMWDMVNFIRSLWTDEQRAANP